MYQLEADTVVDVDKEIDAMKRFVWARWSLDFDPSILFSMAYQAVKVDARFWFDPYPVSTFLNDKATSRISQLARFVAPNDVDLLRFHDQCVCLTRDAAFEALRLERLAQNIDGKWDFSTRARAVYNKAYEVVGSLANVRPHGWDKLAENYVDFDGMDEYDQTDEAKFEGANTESAGAPGFPGRIALPYVMYDDRCQGRPAPYVLVSAAYGHFLSIVKHMNTRAMLDELAAMDFRETERAPVFDLCVHFKNPLLKTMFALVRPSAEDLAALEKEYLESLEHRRAFEAKSPEEQAAIKAENQARTAAEVKAMLSKPLDEEKTNKQAADALNLLRQYAEES